MSEINLEKIIEEVASEPASGSVDGQVFAQHNIKDLIEADRYLQAKKAISKGRLGIKIMRLGGGSVNI